LVNAVTGEESPPGETGELCVRGHCVMTGYYNNPEATARAIDSGGWLHTGDLARKRDDGNYRIVGRSKEMIIRGGENVYPAEIEEFLHRHPSIAEVAVAGGACGQNGGGGGPGGGGQTGHPPPPRHKSGSTRASEPSL